jgi:hypothetical protein
LKAWFWLAQSTAVVEHTRTPEWDSVLFYELCVYDEVDRVRFNHKTVSPLAYRPRTV